MPLLRPLLLVFTLAGIAAAQDGIVRSGGQVLPGATVTATLAGKTATTVTDEDGRYQLKDLTPGDWDVAVAMFGFAPAHQTAKVAAGSTPAEWNLQLQIRPRPTPVVAGGARAGRPGGFQNVALNANGGGQQAGFEEATPAEAAPIGAGGDANESFLVNGTLSQGLSQARPDAGGFGGGFGGPGGGFDPNNPGFGAGGLGGGVAGLVGGGQGGPGGGGPGGGGPGGRGGGGPGGGGGGPRGGGGGGGGGGRGGGGDGAGRQRAGNAQLFGNRAGRGRDGIHGSVNLTFGNSVLNASPYSVNGEDILQPSYGAVRYGLSAGGAMSFPHLIHDSKMFFFVNYTGARSRQPYSATNTLPTLQERAGDFSQTVTSFGKVNIFDPLTSQPFANNIIPPSRFDPTSVKLLSYFPLPNQSGLLNNYQLLRSVPNNNDNLNVRVNRPVTSKDQMDVNVSIQLRDAHNAQLFGYTDGTTGNGLSASIGLTHTFNRSYIDATRVTFSRNGNTTLPFFAYGANVAALVGINGTSSDPRNFGPPNISFTNFGGLTDGSAVVSRGQTAAINNTLTYIRGRETFRMGGDFSRRQTNPVTDANGRGSYSFSGLLTSQFVNGQPVPNTGFDFADYLLGKPQSSSIRFGSTANYFRESAYDAFLTDDIRVRSGLTLMLGVRWEYFTPYSEKYGHLANLDIAPGFSAVSVVLPGQTGPYSGAFSDGLINPQKANFSPRLGIAWKARKNTVTRFGYSIFYNGSVYGQFASRMASQPPFAKSANLVTSVSDPLTIENGFATTPSQAITNTYAIDKDYRMPYVQTWNASVQQTLPAQFQLELTYTGVKGTRLDIQEQPNRSLAGSYLNGQQTSQIKNAAQFLYETSQGNSIYHGLQSRVTRRFSRTTSFNVFYTFSKSIDDASNIGGGGASVAQDFRNLSAERAVSSFNRTHVLNTSFNFTSPVGEQGTYKPGGLQELLLKDWQLTGGVTLSSGSPFTAQVLGNLSNIAGSGSVGSGRAQATGLPLYTGTGFFNLGAFTFPAAGTYGNAGRNTITGPSTLNANASFGRSFRLRDDRRRLEFRLEANNITNSVNITSFNTVVGATNYGLPLLAGGMRTVNATVRIRF